jgi:hypothetical protein
MGNVSYEDFLECVEIVPSAVGDSARLQADGTEILRPESIHWNQLSPLGQSSRIVRAFVAAGKT